MTNGLDLAALGFSLAVFAVAVGVAWGLKRFQITDGTGFIILILLPFLAYGVLSGYIAKIGLPGGWALEFRQLAQAKVQPTQAPQIVDDLRVIEKGSLTNIQALRGTLVVGKPIAVSLRLGRQGYYDERVIADYIRAFLTFDPDLTVMFVSDETGAFVASANANSVLAAVEARNFDQGFVRAVEAADLAGLKQLLALTTVFVTEATTNAQALQAMVNDGVDSIIKVDAAGAAVGVVRRDAIISRLMISLAAAG